MSCIQAVLLVILILSSTLVASDTKEHSFGLGLGIPYGVIGINLDQKLFYNLYASVGTGRALSIGPSYSLGMKCFFNSVEYSFRPRFSAYFGTNGYDEDKDESYTGFSLGLGFQYMYGKSKSNGFDIDIIYIAKSGLDFNFLRGEVFGVEHKDGNLSISIGYRHAI